MTIAIMTPLVKQVELSWQLRYEHDLIEERPNLQGLNVSKTEFAEN